MHTSIEVDVCLSVCFRPWVFLGVDEHEVLCLQDDVSIHVVKVGEVYIPRRCQRFVVVGIHGEAVERHLACRYGDGSVSESHLYTVGKAVEICGVERYLSVYLWSVKRALYGKFTVAISLKPAQLVGYESVGKTERCTCEFKSSINISVSFR